MAINESQIFELLEKIQKRLDSLFVQPKSIVDRKELHAALAAAQSEFRVARSHRENSYDSSKYEALDDVVAVSRPYLAKNGLSVTFPINHTDDGGMILSCILLHSSGQSIESSVRLLPAKNDPKSLASEASFMKRILYSGLTGVVASDEDDDATIAMADHREVAEIGAIRTVLTAKADPREEKGPITKEQYDELEYELGEYPDITQKILDGLKIRDLASMPKGKYHEAIKRVRYIKNLRNNSK